MTLLVFGILAVIVGGIVICFLGDDNSVTFWGVMLCIFGGVLIGSSTTKIIKQEKKVPTAIDVYRGKTTLEITYKDSIAIDSVVVFKNK